MNIIDITDDNIAEYADYLIPDIVENIERDYFRGLLAVAQKDRQPAATMIWEYKHFEDEDEETESSILWFSINDEAVGNMIIDAYIKKSESEGAKRSFYRLPLGLKKEINVLEAAGFTAEEKESPVRKVTLRELSRLPIINGSIPRYIVPISSLTIEQFRKGILKCASDKRKGLLEDLEFLPMNWYDKDVSSCVLTENGINGFLLVNHTASGRIVVDLLLAYEPEAGQNLIHMMNLSLKKALKKYSKDTIVKLVIHNEVSEALIKKLFPNKRGKMCIMGER